MRCVLKMKKKTLHVQREWERGTKTETRVVFERETARRRTRNRIIFTSSFQKFKRETSPPKPTSSSSQQTRANKERERKNTYNIIIHTWRRGKIPQTSRVAYFWSLFRHYIERVLYVLWRKEQNSREEKREIWVEFNWLPSLKKKDEKKNLRKRHYITQKE